MLKTAPEPVDVQDLQFKLRCRLKVFDNTGAANFSRPCNLVTCASRLGLIFVGTDTSNFQVIQLKHLEQYSKSDGDKSDYPRRTVSLLSPPRYLCVNCEHSILAVVIEKNGCPIALFYDVKSFWQQDLVQIAEVRLSPTPGVHVTEINWNPALAAIFTACKSDGTLGIYEIKNPGININELPAVAGATCFCWSPKGKQIAVGSRDGKITQYKPDLKAVKVISSPPLKEPHTLISLQWVSNYQFIGVYQPANPNNQSCLIVIDAPKTGDPTYMNYDDICYSNGNVRPNQFYMIIQQNWNVLMVASSNSMEVGVVGNSSECWTQWIMGDAARAELPLSSDHQETLPIGFALDIGNTQPLHWGELTLPPCPFLLLLSHHGMLCCFNIVNLKEGIPSICAPPDPIGNAGGLQHFVTKPETAKTDNSLKDQITSAVQPTVQLSKLVQPKTTKSFSDASASPFENKITTAKPQGLNLSTTSQPSTLFEGQATLIPVTQGNKSAQSLYPTLPYQSLYPSLPGGDSKGVVITQPVQVPSPFTSSPLTSKTVPAITPQSTSNVTTSNSTKLIQPKLNEELSKTDIINVDLKAEEEAELLFAQMVKEECVFLESELKAVLHQGRSLKLNLGTDMEKTNIVQTTASIQEFFKELADLCMTQNAEVHVLKQNLLQSWAWYEEVKSRHAASKDESMMILLRAQPLDSASEKQLADIRHANYYLESQIAQAHRALDEQWENFQDYCKKTHKMQIPTMEMIFQTMVKQNAILRKQNYVLKDVASRIKSKSRSALGPSLLISVDDTVDLPEELKRLRMNPEDICQIQYEHAVNRTKNLTKKKTETLRSFLRKRECSHVSAVKPHLSTSVLQASPSTKLKSLSNLLEAKASPITKENISKKLDFVQSTPKPVIVKFEGTPDPRTNTPIEGLQNFALKFEAKNFSKPAENSFIPLTKSGIASSPNSAFVSTSFGSFVSTSTSTSSSFKPVIFGTSATTASSFVKTSLNSQMVTVSSSANQAVTISDSSLSKPFSFTSMATVFSQDITGTNLTRPALPAFVSVSTTTTTAASTTKSSFSFSLPTTTVVKTVTTASSVFGKPEIKNLATTKPIFDTVTSKPSLSVTSNLNLTTSPKSPLALLDNSPSTSTKATPTTSLTFASTVSSTVAPVSPFSLASSANTSSIFGTTSEKSNEISTVTPTKPFIFSSVITKTTTAPTVTTTPNRFGVPVHNISTVSSPIQSLSFLTPTTSNVDNTKNNSQSVPASTISSPTVTSKVVTQPVATTVSSSPSVFASAPSTTKTSLFGNFSAASTQQSSIFGSTIVSTQSATSVTKPSIFGSAAVSQPFSSTVVPATTTSVTSIASSTEAVASATPTTTIEATASVPTNSVANSTNLNVVFGTSVTSQPSIFGSSVNTTRQSSSTFAPVSSTTNFGFGNTPSTKSQIFGGSESAALKTLVFSSTPSTTSSTVGFGATTAPQNVTQSLTFDSNTTTPTPIFGGSVPSTTAPPASPFGNVSPSSTSQPQVFGLFGDATQKPSIFGSAAPTSSTQSSVFGSSSQSPIFGGTTTTASPAFTQNQSMFDAQKSTQSIFGQTSGFGSSGSTFGSTSVFGNSATSFAPTTGSIFGNAATTTSGSIFGGTPTTSKAFGGSVFGTPVSSTTSIFGSSSVFSSTASQPTSFAANPSSGSFGFGSLTVGSTPTTSNTGFGATPASNPFGGENKSIFGSSTAAPSNSVFGSSGGSVFGSSSQTFGGNSFGSQSVFGQQSAFGQSSFGGSNFGQQSAGPFSGGSTGSVAQSGFGGTFQKPGGFGGSPVFGSAPSFGSPPSFGGAPSFGSPPAFGSSSKIFGSGNTSFGAPASTQNSSFGNLANQPTVGFGNLAQQASNTPSSNAPFSGSSSFSSWR